MVGPRDLPPFDLDSPKHLFFFIFSSALVLLGAEGTSNLTINLPSQCPAVKGAQWLLYRPSLLGTQLGMPFSTLQLMVQRKKSTLPSAPSDGGRGHTHHQSLLLCGSFLPCH